MSEARFEPVDESDEIEIDLARFPPLGVEKSMPSLQPGGRDFDVMCLNSGSYDACSSSLNDTHINKLIGRWARG